MTRVYRSLGIGPLSGDNAAAQLKRLAEQCGVSDADLAALPNASHRATPAGSRGQSRRDPARIHRRRRWAASGFLPPQIAARFTTGELAALSVISWEHQRSGECRLCITAIAAIAGVGRTTVQNAVRLSGALCLLCSTPRRISRSRNLPNVIRIVSKEWTSWLARRARPSGAPGATLTPQKPQLDTKAPTRLGAPISATTREAAQSPAFRNEIGSSTSKIERGFSR